LGLGLGELHGRDRGSVPWMHSARTQLGYASRLAG
jgi:hypothetical protein